MISASYKPKKKFMQLAITEAKRARDRGDYPIGAVITRLMGRREVVIASAGNLQFSYYPSQPRGGSNASVRVLLPRLQENIHEDLNARRL